MKILLKFSVVLALLSIFILTACKKTNIPPTPEDGGKIRLSKVYRNDILYREYEYSDTGRLLRTSFEPGRTTAESAEFTYDNQGRIVAARKEHPFTGIYILSDVVYKSDGDLERRNEKVYRSSNNQLLGEYQTDITYTPIEDIGKRITVVTRLLPSGPVTSKEIYSYYSSNNYPKIKGSLQSFQKVNSSDSAFYQYYHTKDTETYTSPVKALNPYQYVNTYGYELVRPSMHMPSTLFDDYFRNGAYLFGGQTNYFYDKVINNLIEESRDIITYSGREIEVIRWKYEYLVLKK